MTQALDVKLAARLAGLAYPRFAETRHGQQPLIGVQSPRAGPFAGIGKFLIA